MTTRVPHQPPMPPPERRFVPLLQRGASMANTSLLADPGDGNVLRNRCRSVRVSSNQKIPPVDSKMLSR